MCGLVGVGGVITNNHEKAFRQLLIIDSLRGADSTGAAFIGMDGDWDVVKNTGDPFQLLDMKSFDGRMARKNIALIGHNRFATQGTVNKKNAHPFEFQDIVGAHNGTILNKYHIPDGQGFDVDSAAILHSFNKNGVEPTISKCNGAWALTWWDKRDKTMNFLRNDERTLFYAITENNQTIMWASESWMLTIAAGRNDIKLGAIKQFDKNMHYSFALNTPLGIQELDLVEVRGQERGVQSNFTHGGTWIAGKWVPNNQPATSKSGAMGNQSVTPTGKVITFQPKTETTVGNSLSGQESLGRKFEPGYSGKKNVLLEVLGRGRDENGSDYLICFDSSHQALSIRLYLKKTDNFDKYEGAEIYGDIGKYHVRAGQLARAYYKVEYSTHRLAKPAIEKKKEDVDTFPDSKGKLVPLAEWTSRHGSCCWCNGNILPHDDYRHTKGTENPDDTLCEDCACDPELQHYVA